MTAMVSEFIYRTCMTVYLLSFDTFKSYSAMISAFGENKFWQ